MLQDINERIVPYRDNFDATEREPIYLPAQIPQLFLNGCEGIAVGMKTYIPPHNLGELLNATIELINKPKLTTSDLMKFVKGPDYPTGGIIVNKNELLDLYNTGNGKVVIRGKVITENLSGGRVNLVITEIPYTLSGNKLSLISSIIDLMKDNKLNELAEIRDESSDDIRIVLEVKKGQDVDKLLNKLYKKTKLQDNDSCNFLVVDGVIPKIVGLKEYLEYFIKHQEEITTNKYQLLLEKAIARLEIVEGLLLANDMVDPIIETIRYAKNVSIAKRCLMTGNTDDIAYKMKKNQILATKFKFTERQAQVILDMRLAKLNNLEISAFEKEKNNLLKAIANYEKILGNKKLLHKEIIKYLTEIKDEFSTKRKTSVTNINLNNIVVEEDTPIEEDIQILIDRFDYLKIVDTTSVSRSSDDTLSIFKHNITTKNTDKLAIFTDKGNLYQIKLLDLPKLKMKDKGQPIDVLCKFKEKEDILFICPMNEVSKNRIVFVFNDGYVKNVDGSEYITRQKQIVASKLYNNEISSILLSNGTDTLSVKTNKKVHSINLKEQEVHKKSVKGNKWLKLRPTEKIEEIKIK